MKLHTAYYIFSYHSITIGTSMNGNLPTYLTKYELNIDIIFGVGSGTGLKCPTVSGVAVN